jgi:hypothetical protein
MKKMSTDWIARAAAAASGHDEPNVLAGGTPETIRRLAEWRAAAAEEKRSTAGFVKVVSYLVVPYEDLRFHRHASFWLSRSPYFTILVETLARLFERAVGSRALERHVVVGSAVYETKAADSALREMKAPPRAARSAPTMTTTTRA